MKQFFLSNQWVKSTRNSIRQIVQLSVLYGLFAFCSHSVQAQTCNPNDPTAANGTSFCAPTPTCSSGNFIWSQTIDNATGLPSIIRLIGNSTEWYKIPPASFPAAFSGPVTITVTDVVSYDGYATRDEVPAQPNERWYIRFDKASVTVGQTPFTNDLADLQKQAYWRGPLGSPMYFPNGFDEIILIHENFPNGPGGSGSVAPVSVCINYTSTNSGSIGNFVWNDLNGNGIQDTGEPGIPGVSVKLFGPDCTTVLATATTGGSGDYLFSNLPAGTYGVEFVTPTGMTSSPSNQGSNDETDSDPVAGKVCNIVLASGENNLSIDAGFYTLGSIGNFVWSDLNGNGIQDSGEPGISGVTVRLYAADCTTMLATTTTNGNGLYLFPNLTAGTYGVEFVSSLTPSPANQGSNDEIDSDPVNGKVCNIVLGPGENNLTIDAGFLPLGSIGNFVWNDLNGNGIQDSGEPGISGVTVRLYAADCTTMLATTTTNGSGMYLFPNLAAGTYGVEFVSSLTPSPANQGSNDEIDSDPVNGKVCNIVLGLGENNLTIDAGFYNAGSIGNFVWNDLNGNGIQDPGEPGIPNVTVKLYAANCTTLLATTTTNGSGLYLFPNLVAGTYGVEFVSSLTPSPANQGSNDEIDSDPVNGKVCNIVLGPGENNLTIDAGFVPQGSIGNFVWSDVNGNGIQDPGEPGIPNVTVKLYAANCTTLLATTTTNGSGLYLFPNLVAGTYGVEFVSSLTPSPANQGSNDEIDSDPVNGKVCNIVLGPGENNLTIDAGFVPQGSIGNFVWNDLNGNGIQDPGEPGISGVMVTLYGPNCTTVLATTTTNGSGNYLFPNLPAGTYGVGFVSSLTPSPANQGSNDEIDSDPVNGKVCNIVLGPGENNLTIDAGFISSNSQCYESCSNNPAVGATQTWINNGNGTTTIRTTLAKTFVDNTYGNQTIGWPGNNHTFNHLVGSDILQLALYNGNGDKSMEFKMDYISAGTAPSGYKTLGVGGGNGGMMTGSASDVVSVLTSLDHNLNIANGGAYNSGYTTNSPATNNSYIVNAGNVGWDYNVWYEVTVKNSAFGVSGFRNPLITSMHASPSKTGNNTECVQICRVLTATATGSNGPCATTCQGSINVTPTFGATPYTYTWVDNGVPSNVTTQNRTNLCSGTYIVTVRDANAATATATVTLVNPPTTCPPPICYESCNNNPAVSATQTVTNNGNGTTTIRTTFAKTFVDNTYGNAIIGWPGSHSFGNLTGSDKLQLALYNGNGDKSMEFKIDYISSGSAPSGYKTLGVSGGDGGMITGSASDVVSALTSLDRNLNVANGGAYNSGFTTNSPTTNNSYAVNAGNVGWDYNVWYEVTVKNSAFGASGFGNPLITSIHASPSKTGNNTECVQICRVLMVTATGSNGPCKTNCQGSINVTTTYGTAPFTYTWVDNGVPSNITTQNRTNLCAGTYVVTVRDANMATVTKTVTLVNPPVTCPPAICYESCTGNPAVGATQIVTSNANGTTTIRTTFTKTFVDNTYGNATIGWPGGHSFGNLTGSDKLQLALYNGNGDKSMEFKIDYISSGSAPSGFKTLGVTGGDGGMITGSASDVVSALTSLDRNLNVANGGAYNSGYTTNSPTTNNSYGVNAGNVGWDYNVWYEVTVKNSAFGASGFGHPLITSMHASPSKTGNNTECVRYCLPLTVTATGNNGPCSTTNQGSIATTVAHGSAPYSYSWTGPGGFTSSAANLSTLVPGMYNLTVQDAANETATASITIAPAAACPTEFCFVSEENKPGVSARVDVVATTATTITLRATIAKTYVDNTYGTNTIGWPTDHKFKDLKDKQKLEMTLYDANGNKKLEFKVDYISDFAGAPSGYKSLGVTGGQGDMKTGNASDIVSVMTSLDRNFNTFNYVLTTNSPATNANYDPVAPYQNWIYDVWYEITIKRSAFGAAGFGYPELEKIFAEPSKSGKKDEKLEIGDCAVPPVSPFANPITTTANRGVDQQVINTTLPVPVAAEKVSAVKTTTTAITSTQNTNAVTAKADKALVDVISAGVVIGPNPVKNQIRISGMEKGANLVAIYTADGQLVKTQVISRTQGDVFVQELTPGLFLVKVTSESGISTVKKLIKQ